MLIVFLKQVKLYIKILVVILERNDRDGQKIGNNCFFFKGYNFSFFRVYKIVWEYSFVFMYKIGYFFFQFDYIIIIFIL